MPDLSPAERLEKLRTLEAWLDWQLRDTRRKIEQVEQQVARQRRPRERRQAQAPQRPQRPPAQTGPSTGYKLEPKKHPKHPLPALVHVADCTMADRRTSPIDAGQARLALKDPVGDGAIAACPFCDPGSQLEKEAASEDG